MTFSAAIEGLNMMVRKAKRKKAARLASNA